MRKALRSVSIIIPSRNEEQFIRRCLDSIIQQTYPMDKLEVLAVDGMSEDGTRGVITGYAQQHPWIKLIENPKRITPVALNIGIKNARGDIIIWMSAHNRYEEAYVSRSVEELKNNRGDSADAIMRILPRREVTEKW